MQHGLKLNFYEQLNKNEDKADKMPVLPYNTFRRVFVL